MKILFVIHTPKSPYTAVYNSYHQLVAYLEEQGHAATILAPQDFPSLTRWHARWYPLLYPFWVACWISRQRGQYDLASFHSYAGWVVNLLRGIVPAFQRLRTITSFHGLEPLYYKALKEEMKRVGQPLRFRFQLVHGAIMPWLLRLSCRRSDRIICRNSEEAAYIEGSNWGFESRVCVVPQGVPSQFFIQRQYVHKVRRLLFVGQWLEMKGIRYLAGAFCVLAREAPKLELWCVGTLVEERKVLASFPQEVRQRVVVVPHVTRQEILAVYRDADVFLFPSLSEGFGLARLEAMATAMPIVSTQAGAASDLLESGINALVVPKRNTAALVDSVRQLLNDVHLRERLGRAAQATAAAYELERVHKRLASLYEGILTPRHSGAL